VASTAALPTLDLKQGNPVRTCALAACVKGSRATIVSIGCGADEACRLRAMGLCEGMAVSVVDARHCMVVDVRGTRLALGSVLTAGITVQPLALD
jgi:Fe2+ transport system protein FeoA